MKAAPQCLRNAILLAKHINKVALSFYFSRRRRAHARRPVSALCQCAHCAFSAPAETTSAVLAWPTCRCDRYTQIVRVHCDVAPIVPRRRRMRATRIDKASRVGFIFRSVRLDLNAKSRLQQTHKLTLPSWHTVRQAGAALHWFSPVFANKGAKMRPLCLCAPPTSGVWPTSRAEMIASERIGV